MNIRKEEVKYLSLYKPTYIASTVYDIEYNKLYALGKRIILFDLDNTLISYYEHEPSTKLIEFGNSLLSMGFKVYIVSNNSGKRLNNFTKSFPLTSYASSMKKPSSRRLKKYLEELNINNFNEIIMIGDQMLTDILCANRLGVDSILVKSISRKSEKWYTTINRLREPIILKSIAKQDPVLAKEIKKLIKKDE